MFMKKPQNRTFDYTPRYYVKETDEKERKKRKLGFSRHLKIKRKKKNLFFWALLIILIIFVILELNGLT